MVAMKVTPFRILTDQGYELLPKRRRQWHSAVDMRNVRLST